jgi:predicted Zn-dependent protease
VQEIAEWLDKLGMSEYAQRFAQNGIDFSVLPHLTDQDRKDTAFCSGTADWLRRTLKIAPDAPIASALLASTLALTGRQAEASEALKRYLSLKATTSKTIAEFRPQHRALSDNPKWLAYSDRLVEGLRKAGMPEE